MGTCQGLISVSVPAGFAPLPSLVTSLELFQIIQNESVPRNTHLDEEEILSVTFPQTQPLFWSNLPLLPTLPRVGKLWKLIWGEKMRKEGNSKEQNSPKDFTMEQSGLAGTKCHLPIPRGLASLQSRDLIPATFPELPCLIPKSAS